MTENERFGIATRLFVLLKRRMNRSIDTVWLMENTEYALEIVRLCRSTGEEELVKAGDRLEQLTLGAPSSPGRGVVGRPPVGRGYVGSLR